MHIARFPRVRLAHLPATPERMPRLSEELGIDPRIERDAPGIRSAAAAG